MVFSIIYFSKGKVLLFNIIFLYVFTNYKIYKFGDLLPTGTLVVNTISINKAITLM